LSRKTDHLITRLWFRLKTFLSRKYGVFLIFFVIATFLWFLQAMERNYTTVIQHPVKFTSLPENLVLTNKLPDKLNIEVTGTGFAILKHNWDLAKSAIRLDLKEVAPVQHNVSGGKDIHLSLRSLKNRISAQLNNVQVLSIKPDTIIFQFSKMIRKKIPVYPDVQVDPLEGYMLKGHVTADPDSVWISGPNRLVDTIKQVPTDFLRFRKLNKSVEKHVALINYSDELVLSETHVTITVPVEQFTEKTLRIPVQSIHVPDSLSLKTFPASITISFKVVISEFDRISPDDFVAAVDYEQISEEQHALKVYLIRTPSFIDHIRIAPETVDYILEK